MRIGIIGRTQFLFHTAEYLLKKGYEIPVVITAASSPEYTKREDDFKELSDKFNAKFINTNTLNNIEIIDKLQGLDIGISMNWISVIEQKHIDCFSLGILNAHFGDLPRYRGNACPNWAIINGENEVVLSVHLMEGDKLDCGRIIVQEKLSVTEDTYIGDVYKWGERVIPEMFSKALVLLSKDPQYTLKYADADSPESLRCYPRRTEDSRINWAKSAEVIHRLIRASSEPFSGAYGYIDGEKIVIWRAELFDDGEQYCAVPGQICDISDKYFVVITGNDKLKVTEWDSVAIIKSIRQRLS